MADRVKRLGDAELEIMQVLWRSDKPATSSYVWQKLQGRRKWALSTLMTSLARLADKGFVECDRTTGTNLYSALMAEEEYKARESRSLLEKLFGNSLPNLVTSLYNSKVIDHSDLSELRRLLDEIDRGE